MILNCTEVRNDMPRVRKPQTKYDLYKKVLMMWYCAEYENVRAFVYDRSTKLRERKKLKEKYDALLNMWQEVK